MIPVDAHTAAAEIPNVRKGPAPARCQCDVRYVLRSCRFFFFSLKAYNTYHRVLSHVAAIPGSFVPLTTPHFPPIRRLHVDPTPLPCRTRTEKLCPLQLRREEVGIASAQALVRDTGEEIRRAEADKARVTSLKADLARFVFPFPLP